MDDAASIIGTVSFAFQVFGGVLKGLKMLSDARSFGTDLTWFSLRLKVEMHRLQQWGRFSGIVEDKLDQRLNVTLIYEILGQLKVLLTDYNGLQAKYDINLQETRPEAPAAMTEIHVSAFPDIFTALELPAIVTEQRRILERSQKLDKDTNIVKRLWMVNFDKPGLTNLVRDIETLVTTLYNFLDDVHRECARQELECLQLDMLRTVKKVDQIHILLEGLQFGQSSANRAAEIASPHGETGPSARLGADPLLNPCLEMIEQRPQDAQRDAIALRRLRLEIDSNFEAISSQSGESRKGLYVSQNHSLELGTPLCSGTMSGTLRGNIPVLIESQQIPVDVESETSERLMRRQLEELAMLFQAPKASEYCILPLLGLRDRSHEQHFEMVFDIRPALSHSVVSIHTHQIPGFEVTNLSRYMQSSYTPSITDRVRLAYRLSLALLYLHSSGWLHKSIQSDNVYFFNAATQDSRGSVQPLTSRENRRSIESPYLMGYGLSRMDQDGNYSLNPSIKEKATAIYRHPMAVTTRYLPSTDTQRQRRAFKKEYDVYAFGLLLVEIGLWKSLPKVFSDHKISYWASSSTFPNEDERLVKILAKVRIDLLDESKSSASVLRSLRFRMGDLYARVVRTCLSDTFEDSTLKDETYIRTFSETVVQGLKRIVV